MGYVFDNASPRYVMLDSAHGDEYAGASNKNGNSALSNKQARWLVDTLSGVAGSAYASGVASAPAKPYTVVVTHREPNEQASSFGASAGLGVSKHGGSGGAIFSSFTQLMTDFSVDLVVYCHMSVGLSSVTQAWTGGG